VQQQQRRVRSARPFRQRGGQVGEGQLHGHFLLNDRQPEGSGDQTVARNVVLHNNKVCPGDQEEGIPETSGSGIVLLGRWTTSSAATS